MTERQLKEKLISLQDIKYRDFSVPLIPGASEIIGVRLPLLRKIAKDIAKENYKEFLEGNSGVSHEEIMIEGMVIGYIKCGNDEKIQYIKNFVPKINNWAVCDSFAGSLKCVEKDRPAFLGLIETYSKSQKEFESRFAAVMLLGCYITENYIDTALKILDGIKNTAFYSRMAVAWAVSVCYVKFPDKTLKYLKDNTLDDFTFNKAIDKIRDSYRVDAQSKKLLLALKRKKATN